LAYNWNLNFLPSPIARALRFADPHRRLRYNP
jgi:hypothetical protein